MRSYVRKQINPQIPRRRVRMMLIVGNENNYSISYNVELASKSENRIKETIKQIALAEQVYRDQTEAVQARQKEFQDGLIESQKQLNMVLIIFNIIDI